MFIYVPCAMCSGLTVVATAIAFTRVWPTTAFLATMMLAWAGAAAFATSATAAAIVLFGGWFVTLAIWFVIMVARERRS